MPVKGRARRHMSTLSIRRVRLMARRRPGAPSQGEHRLCEAVKLQLSRETRDDVAIGESSRRPSTGSIPKSEPFQLVVARGIF
jgi:hypothetical protein